MDSSKYHRALELQNAGRYREAIAAAVSIPEPELRACILVDSGLGAGKPKLIREGVTLFESMLEPGPDRFSRASILYNIANGYSSLFKLRRLKGVHVVPPNDDDLRKAKRAYRNALAERKGNPPNLRAQILTNYADCLSALGRSFEAIQAYGDALQLDSSNGTASGNMGIELGRVSNITGRYRHHYLLEAQRALAFACSAPLDLLHTGSDAHEAFCRELREVQRIIDAHEGTLKPLERVLPPPGRSKAERYTIFCLERGLFLNAWVGDPTVAPALSDEVAFGAIVTDLDDFTTVPDMLRILNEAKEEFATARYLLYLSLSRSRVLDEVSGLTSYFDAAFTDQNGLYLGLCKAAYARSFDVLDKVARIVNVYFTIGKRRDSFWKVFAEQQSRGESHQLRYVARPAITATSNYSLYALADLCIDYFESEHVDLRTIDDRRNLITHDYLAVTGVGGRAVASAGAEISADELFRQTEAVLRLAKNGILYAVTAVHIAESTRSPGRVTQIRYEQSPGQTWAQLPKGKSLPARGPAREPN